MLKQFRWPIAILVVAAVVASSVCFQVREGDVAVVTRLGAPRVTHRTAGLHFKLPWPIERAHRLDGRRQVLNSRYAETLTRDQKNVILRTYVTWAVDDPLRFLQAMGDIETGASRLDGLITDATNAVVGTYELAALVNTDASQIRVAEVERNVLEQVGRVARERFGIAVERVGLKQLGLPAENIPEIFARMRAERGRVASEIRAKGEQNAKKIRNDTEKQVAEIQAEGRITSAKIRAEGRAKAARIYREAHSQDPNFYGFIGRLNAARDMLGERATLVAPLDMPPFDVLRMPTPTERATPKPDAAPAPEQKR